MAHPDPANLTPAPDPPQNSHELRLDAAQVKVGESALSRWRRQWSLAPASIATRIAGIEACIDEWSAKPDGPTQLRFFPRC